GRGRGDHDTAGRRRSTRTEGGCVLECDVERRSGFLSRCAGSCACVAPLRCGNRSRKESRATLHVALQNTTGTRGEYSVCRPCYAGGEVAGAAGADGGTAGPKSGLLNTFCPSAK